MTGRGVGFHFIIDEFRLLYCAITIFAWIMMIAFSGEYMSHDQHKRRYYIFTVWTLAATIGVFLSADLYTMFVFFEMMSFTSYIWVVHNETKESLRAGVSYLTVAVIGGLVMLMGLFMLYHAIGTLEINAVMPACRAYADKTYLYIAGGCMLFGFGAKAGVVPLHIWLPKAHLEAPAPASALLSGILTKTGIFGILILTCNMFATDAAWGTLILLFGTITMAVGAALALFSINIKKILACSSISQIGFILIGIGMQDMFAEVNAYAVRGTLLHMVNHSLFKAVLFMTAGVIYMNVHKLDLNEIRGFGHGKPALLFLYLAGALGIGGIPFFSGYISKTLLHESIVEYTCLLESGAVSAFILNGAMMRTIEWIFIISGGITVAYMLKLFVAIFVEKNLDADRQKEYDALNKKYMNPISLTALSAGAVWILIFGVLPYLTIDRLADMGQEFMHLQKTGHVTAYFSLSNLKGAGISVMIGIIIYFAIVRMYMMKQEPDGVKEYIDRWNPKCDLENAVYRPILLKALPIGFGIPARVCDRFIDSIIVLLRKTIYKDSPIPHELDEGTMFTHISGMLVDRVICWRNKISGRENKEEKYYEHKFAIWHDKLRENNMMIARRLSFGLLLFCLGLILTLLYLLLE